MADVTFISSLLTTSPYPNIKMFKEGFIPAGYIYTDSSNYKASEDKTFLYCCEQDERDPEGQTTLAIYYDDPGGDPDMDDYTEYANDHPAFYRGRSVVDGETFDKWDMYEDGNIIMTFLTEIITTDVLISVDFISVDLTQYCPIYEDLLKTAFETSKFPNTSFSNTQTQVVGSNGSVSSGSSYMISSPTGNIGGLSSCDYLVFVQGTTARGMASSFTWSGTTWANKIVVFHPGYIDSNYTMRRVDSSIFTTWIIQTSSISTSYATCYFSVVDIDMLNSIDDRNGIVTVAQPPISIPLHTPTCIFWGKTIYKGHNLIVPVAVAQWTSGGTSVSSRTIIDWKTYMPY